LKTIGSKRLLILDNHESHTTPEFRDFCTENNIFLLWMPPYTSHLLQPLDVGCFSPLKTVFGKVNQHLIRNRIFHIRKEDFLVSFYKAYSQVFTQTNIQAGFRGSGLHPFNPQAVLSLLGSVPSSPASLPRSLQEAWQPKTPSNALEIDKQATLIKQKLERHHSSSPSPMYEALSQLTKGAQAMAASAALLQNQVTELQKVNMAFQTRRKKRSKWFNANTAVSVGEGQAKIDQGLVEAQIMGEIPRPQKRPITCSNCKQQGHNNNKVLHCWSIPI